MRKVAVATLRDARVPATQSEFRSCSALGTDPVTPPRNQIPVDRQAIGVHLLAGKAPGDATPHPLALRLIERTQGEAERLSALIAPVKPDPRLPLLGAYESPDLIELDGVGVSCQQDALFKGRYGLDFF